MLPAVAAKYGDQSSTAAAEWYERTRRKWFDEEYDAQAAAPFDDTAMRKSIRWKAGVLFGDDPEEFLPWANSALDRWVKQSGRDTIHANARKDPRKPRYARVPQGPTCAFCIMLASRGFVYASAESAGGDMNDYHADCDCEIIPNWDKKNPKIEGYDPEALYKRYTACRSTVEDLLTQDRYQQTYLDPLAKENDKATPLTFDQWITREILHEMDWRDRQWLYDGTQPAIEFANEALRKETEENRAQEIRTAERARMHGIKPYFQVDYKEIENPRTHVMERAGLADWRGGTEIKTLDTAKTARTIDSYLGNTSKKADATRLIFDNTESLYLTDEQLVEFINRSHRFRRGAVYVITKSGKLLRIK